MMNFSDLLQRENEDHFFVINDNEEVKKVLSEKSLDYIVVDYDNALEGWEADIVSDRSVGLWIDDRLDTGYSHSEALVQKGVKLATFDDCGEGATLADLNISALNFNDCSLKGKRVLKGLEYLVLNEQVNNYKRLRNDKLKVMVTFGGSDTYGVTLQVVEIIKEIGLEATIYVGPSFKHQDELEQLVDNRFRILRNTPSLVGEMIKYDLAITGGGITPFEANATGLPCLTISSEDHEIQICKYLDDLGASAYLGHRGNISAQGLKATLSNMDVEKMSKIGMDRITTVGASNVWKEIKGLKSGR